MSIQFANGVDANGQVVWTGSYSPAPAGVLQGPITIGGRTFDLIVWTRHGKDSWPRAIRVTLGMRQVVGGQETIVDSEIVVNLPK